MGRCEIIVKDNGSLKIKGDFVIFDIDGKEFDLSGRTEISLCRCGLSQNKPFCDSSHKNGAFESRVRAFTLPPPIPKDRPAQ
jgi:CDGSH-type Zn-finger protein